MMFRPSLVLLAILAILQTAVAVAAPPFIPIYYSYGGYPRIMANISYGTPAQPAIPAVVDLGSANFWVDQRYSKINYGCNDGILCLGPCNVTAQPAYDYRASKTASKPVPYTRLYSYGGNGKFVFTNYTVNDTMCFGEQAPALRNRRVALANFTIMNMAAAPHCAGSAELDYDHSILGISRPKNPSFPTAGPSFRQDLQDSGAIASSSMSMWFDRGIGAANQTYHGTVLFGAVPGPSKYGGPLTKVKLSPPSGAYVGYYLGTPSFAATNVKTGNATSLAVGSAKQCLLDSGTGNDILPVDQNHFLKTTGLILYNGYPAFDGPCDAIPHNAYIALTFAGSTQGKKVTIRTPLRNYARGNTDYAGNKNKCGLSLDLDLANDCVLGAPSSTSFFLAVDDDANEIAIAQGGQSTGAQDAVAGLGPVHIISKGKALPAV